eukprot:gene5295-6138_t
MTTSEKSYTSSVSDDSSYFTRLRLQTTNSVFSILYAMVDGNIFPKIFIILSTIIEFIELISFAFYRSYFPWPTELRFMSYIYSVITKTPLSSYSTFNIFFWLSQAIFYLALANTVFVAYHFHRKNYRFLLPIKTLRIFVAGLVTFLVIPLVSLWSISFNCRSGYILHFPEDVKCYNGLNVVNIALSILSLIILVPYSIVTCSTYFEMNPHVKNTFSRMNSRYEVVLLIIKILLTFLFQLIYTSYITLGILFFLFMFTTVSLSIILMPFHNHIMNQFRTALGSVCLWAGICLLAIIAVNDPSSRITMIVFVAGIIPAFIFGAVSIELRKRYLLKRVDEFIENPTTWKPFIVSTDYEIVSRYLLADTKNDSAIDTINRVYLRGLEATPNAPMLLKAYCYFLKVHKNDHVQSHTILERLRETKPAWDTNFFVYHQDQERERRNDANGVGAGQKFEDFMVYLDFKRIYGMAKHYHVVALKSINKFWTIAAQRRSAQFALLSEQSARIARSETKANKFYRNLLELHPTSSRIMRDYARFVDDVMNDKDLAAQLLERANKAEEEISARNHPGIEDGPPRPLTSSKSSSPKLTGLSTSAKPIEIIIDNILDKNEIELESFNTSQRSLNSSNSSPILVGESTLDTLDQETKMMELRLDVPVNSSNSLSSSMDRGNRLLRSSAGRYESGELPSVEEGSSSPPLSTNVSVGGAQIPHETSGELAGKMAETKVNKEIKKRRQPIAKLSVILIIATGFFMILMMGIFAHLRVRLEDQTYAVQRLRITGSLVVTASNIALYARQLQVSTGKESNALEKVLLINSTNPVNQTALVDAMKAYNSSLPVTQASRDVLDRRSVQLINLHQAIYYGEKTITKYDRDHYKLVNGFTVTYGLDTGARYFKESDFNKTRYSVAGKSSDIHSFYHANDIMTSPDNTMVSPWDIMFTRTNYGIDLHNKSLYFWKVESESDPTFRWLIDNTKNLATSLTSLFEHWLGDTKQLAGSVLVVNIAVSLAVVVAIVVFNIFLIRPVVNNIVSEKIEILGAFQHIPRHVSERMANAKLHKLYLLENELRSADNARGRDYDSPMDVDSDAMVSALSSGGEDETSSPRTPKIQFADGITDTDSSNGAATPTPTPRTESLKRRFSMRMPSFWRPSESDTDLLKSMQRSVSMNLHRKYLISEFLVGIMIVVLLVVSSIQIVNIRDKTTEVFYAEQQSMYIRMIFYYAQEIRYYNNVTTTIIPLFEIQNSLTKTIQDMTSNYLWLKDKRSSTSMQGKNFFYNTRECLRKIDPCINATDPTYPIISQGLDAITLAYFDNAAILASVISIDLKNTTFSNAFEFIRVQSKEDLYDGTDQYAYQIGRESVAQVTQCLLTVTILSSVFTVACFVLYFIFFRPLVLQLQFESKNTIAMLNMIPQQYDQVPDARPPFARSQHIQGRVRKMLGIAN